MSEYIIPRISKFLYKTLNTITEFNKEIGVNSTTHILDDITYFNDHDNLDSIDISNSKINIRNIIPVMYNKNKLILEKLEFYYAVNFDDCNTEYIGLINESITEYISVKSCTYYLDMCYDSDKNLLMFGYSITFSTDYYGFSLVGNNNKVIHKAFAFDLKNNSHIQYESNNIPIYGKLQTIMVGIFSMYDSFVDDISDILKQNIKQNSIFKLNTKTLQLDYITFIKLSEILDTDHTFVNNIKYSYINDCTYVVINGKYLIRFVHFGEYKIVELSYLGIKCDTHDFVNMFLLPNKIVLKCNNVFYEINENDLFF